MSGKTSTVRPSCRLKQQAMGLAYPRSSCEKCGSIIRVGWRCAEETAAKGQFDSTPEWTEGVCEDGVAIFRDGVMMPISGVLAALNELERLRARPKGATYDEFDFFCSLQKFIIQIANDVLREDMEAALYRIKLGDHERD